MDIHSIGSDMGKNQAQFKMMGAAVSVVIDGLEVWFWVIEEGPRPDTYVCERCHTNETAVFHEEDFYCVI